MPIIYADVIELLDRFRKKTSIEDIISANLQPADLQLLLSSMYLNLVGRISPSDLLKRYSESRFVQTCAVPQKELIELDTLCYENLPPQFESVEFSAVAPLGTNSILSRISQNVVMSGVRNVEVVADPTTIIALECALRRKSGSKTPNHLATSMRCLRLQPFEKETGFTPHFRIFALGSSGRRPKMAVLDVMGSHLDTVLRIANQLNRKVNSVAKTEVYISDIAFTERVIGSFGIDRQKLRRHAQGEDFKLFNLFPVEDEELVPSISKARHLLQRFTPSLQNLVDFERNKLTQLKSTYPNVEFMFDLGRIAGIGYYNGPCYKVICRTKEGVRVPIADGGYSDWVAKVLSDDKETFFSSGIGTELFYKMFINK